MHLYSSHENRVEISGRRGSGDGNSERPSFALRFAVKRPVNGGFSHGERRQNATRWSSGGYGCSADIHNIPRKKPLIILMSDNKQSEIYGHVLKYTSIFGGVQGLSILISLVRNKLVALMLGPAGMGLVSLFNSILNFLSQATSLGISFSAVRHLSEIFDSGDDARIRHFVKIVRAWSMVAAALGFVLCVAAASVINSYVFDSGESHTWQVAALAPMVAMVAVTGGETAILKGARRLRELAGMQVYMVVAALVIAVPVYWKFRDAGIIPVLALTTLANMVLTMRVSARLYPFSLSGAAALLGEGAPMVRLGMAFIVSGVFGSGAEMVVRSFLNNCADLDTVGLYNAGFMITVTYAGMVFSAMETDYFPRLSAVNHDTAAVNLAANRQIEVSLLIIAPMLTFLIMALPLLIPLLYSGKFTPVVDMAQVATLSMYSRAMMLPVAYMALAKGHSRAYLVLEGVSATGLVVLVMLCFSRWGLTGAGVGILLANVFDLAVTLAYARYRYRYRLSRHVLKYAAAQVPIGVAAYLATFADAVWLSVCIGVAATLASTAISVYILHKKTSLWNKLKTKFIFSRKRG